MTTQHFNATDELEKIREYKKIRGRKRYAFSRLRKLRTEVVLLRQSGASYREITYWLRQKKRIKMSHITVMRYLSKLPELKKEKDHA